MDISTIFKSLSKQMIPTAEHTKPQTKSAITIIFQIVRQIDK